MDKQNDWYKAAVCPFDCCCYLREGKSNNIVAALQVLRFQSKTFQSEGWFELRNVKCSEIYYADLSPVVGSEQDGTRPVLVIQNDTGNKFSPTTIVAAITSKSDKAKLPTQG